MNTKNLAGFAVTLMIGLQLRRVRMSGARLSHELIMLRSTLSHLIEIFK